MARFWGGEIRRRRAKGAVAGPPVAMAGRWLPASARKEVGGQVRSEGRWGKFGVCVNPIHLHDHRRAAGVVLPTPAPLSSQPIDEELSCCLLYQGARRGGPCSFKLFLKLG